MVPGQAEGQTGGAWGEGGSDLMDGEVGCGALWLWKHLGDLRRGPQMSHVKPKNAPK
jgi:hypothetical protein